MANFEKTEYLFPDEKEEAEKNASLKDGEIEIEIVDNTPPADRNREPLDTPPEDVTDEELERYTDTKLKERLAKLGKGYHDERRAKETATREKEEAIRMAQAVVEENKRLKGSLSTNQEALLDQAKRVVANELEKAKVKYKSAYESGDSNAMLEAQEDLTVARMKVERVNNFKPQALQDDRNEVQNTQITQTPPVDPKAEAWKSRNPWFGKDREMTGYAFALHEKLVMEDGVDPNSDEYYKKLNGRIRQVFPEKFSSEESADAHSSQRSYKSNVVAPATRSTAPRKIVLSPDQVRMANRLGVPLKLYAEKVAEQERKKNG
jgi:hypothetical protein|tara:strand:- start:1097 stop:2056 length:960 start_codon:yes stop_codon:yes gene_type:complete